MPLAIRAIPFLVNHFSILGSITFLRSRYLRILCCAWVIMTDHGKSWLSCRLAYRNRHARPNR